MNLLPDQIQLKFHAQNEPHYELNYTVVSMIANIFLPKNILLDGDIVMTLPEIYKSLTTK
jgi:hypothetical protein